MQDRVAANHFNLNDACRLLSGDLTPSDAACQDWINAVYDNDTTKLEIQPRVRWLPHNPSRRPYDLRFVASAQRHRYEGTWPRDVWTAPEKLLSYPCREGRQRLSAQVHGLSCDIIGRHPELRNDHRRSSTGCVRQVS